MYEFAFESYGVRVALECDDGIAFRRAVEVISKSLLGKVVEIERSTTEHTFEILRLPSGLSLKLDGEWLTEGGDQLVFFKYFDTWVRLVVAEHAKNYVFLHAGVVAVGNKGILFPGNSFTGKTTLVAELIKHGAIYYSDEYAVIDNQGRVRPFARDLALRDRNQPSIRNDTVATSLGGVIGLEPIEVAAVFLLAFERNSRWSPKKLTAGEGLMNLLPQAISLRFNSELTISVLNALAKNATFVKSKRGSVENCVYKILNLIDKI